MSANPALRQRLDSAGATWGDASTMPLHFGDPAAELRAALDATVLADRSSLARWVASGPDLLALLNRLSTNAVARLAPGEGAATVITTGKGRILDRLWVHRTAERQVVLVGSDGAQQRVGEHLARYTFTEETGLEPAGDTTALLALSGPRAADALSAAGLARPGPLGSAGGRITGDTVTVLGQDGLQAAGASVLVPEAAAAAAWDTLLEAVASVGGRAAGREALESARILRGLPAGGHELTEEANPLEAGLWDAVDFDKGCYVGQEVVARLRTYDKVARALVGLELDEAVALPVEPGTPLLDDRGVRVGHLTSAIHPPGRRAAIGLGYVKRKHLRPDLVVVLGATGDRARVVELPFHR